jgi:hypothetical protein
MKKTKLEQKSYDRLRTLAARAGIRGRSRMRKKALVAALLSQPSSPSSARARKSRLSRHRAEKPQDRLYEMTELPASYGQTRLVLLEVDPHQVHAYWEVTPADRSDASKHLGVGMPPAPWILRFYEFSTSESGGAQHQRCFDVPVDLAPGNWYVQVPGSGKSYRAELGPISSGGRFHAACRSNEVSTARAHASTRFQPKWLEVRDAFQVVRRVPEPRSESPAQDHIAAGPEVPVVRENPIQPSVHPEGRTFAVAQKRAAAGESIAASASSGLRQDGPGVRMPAGSDSLAEDLSSFALGGPGRESAGVDPARDTKIRRSD